MRGNIFLEFELWPIEIVPVLEEKSSSHGLGIILGKKWNAFCRYMLTAKIQCCCHLKPVACSLIVTNPI